MTNPQAKFQLVRSVPGEDYKRWRWNGQMYNEANELILPTGEADTLPEALADIVAQIEFTCGNRDEWEKGEQEAGR